MQGRTFDVVVVGARCAGAATAMLLARAGHRVLAIDRGRYATDTVSTHALMRGAVVLLHRWGLLPALVANRTPAVRQATFYYGADKVEVPVTPRDGIDALYAPRRILLDRLLADAAAAAGAELAYGVRLRELQRSSSGRIVGVILEDGKGTTHQVSSRIVVGADGLRSTVARLVAAPAYRVGRHATATIYGHWDGVDASGYEWYFAQGLSAGAIPTNDGQVCVSLSVPAEEFTGLFAHRPGRAFHDLLSQVAPDLARQVAGAGAAPLHGFPGQPGFFRQSYGPGWALVGDAGYFKDPLTAHGITDALRDAERLARAIEIGSEAALADYHRDRDEVSLDLFETTDAVASFAWNLTDVRVLHEALARAMAREVRQLASA